MFKHMTDTIKKVISDADSIVTSLLMKARKPKGLAKWKKLKPTPDFAGKEQKHITFVSQNPKSLGKPRTLASKEGALDFLLGYVSPKFHFAPWHLKIINPDLDDQKAAEWFAIMKHPSKVPPSQVNDLPPEGDFELGFVHPSVAAEFPNKNIELFTVIQQPTDKIETIATPDLVVPDAEAPMPQEEGGEVSDLLLACPFGGGLQCKTMGGSGSPWHHFYSDSMKAHIAKIGEGNLEVPKMGTFKGQPALFFTNNDEPYVALPMTQEIYSKSGAVYLWSFLSEGPLAKKHPLMSKIMNKMANKKPLIIPEFNIPEPVVAIAHDAVPAEDPAYAEFSPEVAPLIQESFPRPGSVIPLGIVKGDHLFAVVTSKSLDFYDEMGKGVYYPASDGMYYAYFDLAVKTTPAFVLISFINTFMSTIDTSPLEEPEESDMESDLETPESVQSPDFGGHWASPYSPDGVEAKLANTYMKVSKSFEGKPDYWYSKDLPPASIWVFSANGFKYFLINDSNHIVPTPNYILRDAKGSVATTGPLHSIHSYLGMVNITPNTPPGVTYSMMVESVPAPVESLVDVSKSLPLSLPIGSKISLNSEINEFTLKQILERVPVNSVLRVQGAPVSVYRKTENTYGSYIHSKGGYSFDHIGKSLNYLSSQLQLSFSKYGKDAVTLTVLASQT